MKLERWIFSPSHAEGTAYIGPGLGNLQSGPTCDPQPVSDLVCPPGLDPNLDGVSDDSRPTPTLRGGHWGCAGGKDGRSRSDLRYEDVDLEPLETGLVAVGTPVQDLPRSLP